MFREHLRRVEFLLRQPCLLRALLFARADGGEQAEHASVEHLRLIPRAKRNLAHHRLAAIQSPGRGLDDEFAVHPVRGERAEVPHEIVVRLRLRSEQDDASGDGERRDVAKDARVGRELKIADGGQRRFGRVPDPLARVSRDVAEQVGLDGTPAEFFGENTRASDGERGRLAALERDADLALVRLLLDGLEHEIHERRAKGGDGPGALHARQHREIPGVGVQILHLGQIERVAHLRGGGVAQLDRLRGGFEVADDDGAEGVHRHRRVGGAKVETPCLQRDGPPAELQAHAPPVLDGQERGEPVRSRVVVAIQHAHGLSLPRLEHAELGRHRDDLLLEHEPLVRVNLARGLANLHPIFEINLRLVTQQQPPLHGDRPDVAHLEVQRRGFRALQPHAETRRDPRQRTQRRRRRKRSVQTPRLLHPRLRVRRRPRELLVERVDRQLLPQRRFGRPFARHVRDAKGGVIGGGRRRYARRRIPSRTVKHRRRRTLIAERQEASAAPGGTQRGGHDGVARDLEADVGAGPTGETHGDWLAARAGMSPVGSSNRTSASNSLHPSSHSTSRRYRTTPLL